MESHSHRNVHDKNPYTKNMESHSHRNVHDENPYTKKWTVICTEMCMTQTNSKKYGSYSNIHYNIVYISSLHHAINALKSIAHMENSKNRESHSHRNVHDENPFKKRW